MRERPQAFRRDGSRRCSDVRLHRGNCVERPDTRPALLARLGHDLDDAPDPPPPPAIEADDHGQRCAQPALTLFPRHTTPRRTPHGIPLHPIAEHHTASHHSRRRRHAAPPVRLDPHPHPHPHPPQARRSPRPRGSRRWIDGDILPPGLQERRGRQGTGLLTTGAIEGDRPAG